VVLVSREPVLVRLLVVVRVGRDVHDDGLGLADVLESVPDVGRDLDELFVVLAEEELVHDALRGYIVVM
jgi:hypothetical protein